MPWTRYTLASLRTHLAARVDQVPYWSPEEQRLALNEGLAFWNLLTGTWKTRVTIDADPASSPLMALPATLVFGVRVAYQGQPLANSSLVDLMRGRPSCWTENVGTGAPVPTRPMIWAPVSLALIAVWPRVDRFIPGAITVDGIAATPTLTSEDASVDLEDGVLDVLLGYALHALTFKEGWQRFAATGQYLKAFLALAAEQNSQLTASAAFRQYMGQARKDLVPTRGVPERLTAAVSAAGSPE